MQDVHRKWKTFSFSTETPAQKRTDGNLTPPGDLLPNAARKGCNRRSNVSSFPKCTESKNLVQVCPLNSNTGCRRPKKASARIETSVSAATKASSDASRRSSATLLKAKQTSISTVVFWNPASELNDGLRKPSFFRSMCQKLHPAQSGGMMKTFNCLSLNPLGSDAKETPTMRRGEWCVAERNRKEKKH